MSRLGRAIKKVGHGFIESYHVLEHFVVENISNAVDEFAHGNFLNGLKHSLYAAAVPAAAAVAAFTGAAVVAGTASAAVTTVAIVTATPLVAAPTIKVVKSLFDGAKELFKSDSDALADYVKETHEHAQKYSNGKTHVLAINEDLVRHPHYHEKFSLTSMSLLVAWTSG